jgi:hypothetical protein
MDRDDTPFVFERDASPAAQAGIDFEKLGISAQDAMLIAAAWGALISFIVYSELQLIVFGATVLGVAALNRTGKRV